jgi:hypothetical protein
VAPSARADRVPPTRRNPRNKTKRCGSLNGSAVCLLLGEEGRISLDVDVAAPYCTVQDALVLENLANLKRDCQRWIG